MEERQLYFKNDKGRYEPYRVPEPPYDNMLYRKRRQGGESGVNARRTPADWFRGLRDACRRWNTLFFFKQWGAWGEDGVKRSKYKNGSLLDGEEWKQYPVNRQNNYRAKQEEEIL